MSQQNYVADAIVIDEQKKKSLGMPVFMFFLAMIYVLSPIDAIPDVPVIGYIDDFFVAAIATLNLLQAWLARTSLVLAAILGWLKWFVVFVGIIAVALVGLAVWGIAKLFIV
ncbi:MAG TPA: DUF1232 domain-containing protein [Smithellaceae bacterium]|nr:DUF1232 domain-containing protein [Smithellaceae bacterium]HRS89247.1 DUF1232 domain-containing protein [Smithellaceae bacterium]HRV26295.1 DUF1232 domain-containing protein [Smithellaceae bacterium]